MMINLKKKIALTIMGLFMLIPVYSKDNDTGKELLEKISNKVANSKNVKIFFDINIVNKQEGINEKQEGILITEKEKFNLKIKGQTIFCDGKTIWTVINDAEEVQITSFDEQSEEFTPSNIFNLYKKGFNSKEKPSKGNLKTILLYPQNPRGKEFHRIEIEADKVKVQINKITIKEKSGGETIYVLRKIMQNITTSPSDFKFNTSNFPNFEVIDLR